RLREKSDAAAQRAAGCARELDAIDGHRAARRRNQTSEHAQRRRLAGAVGAEQRDDFGSPYLEVQIVDGGSRAEAASEMAGGNHGENSYNPGVTSSRPFLAKKRLFG